MTTEIATIKEQLANLVAFKSVSSTNPDIDMSNRQVVEALDRWFSAVGFTTNVQRVDRDSQKFNLVARFGEGDGGLVLSGHTDTVPCDPKLWRSDPWVLDEREDRLYGLGTADMKGFFPVVLAALKRIDHATFVSPLTVLATADEESTMAGARALSADPTLRNAIGLIGEPTSLIPIDRHKGVTMVSIIVTGRAGHSSDPALGNNALDGMNQIISALDQFRTDLRSRFTDTNFKVPAPTLNFGYIRGGDNPNRICGSCELQVDLRVIPGMDIVSTFKELTAVVKESVEHTGLDVVVNELMTGIDAYKATERCPGVALAETLTGTEAQSIAFATEAPLLQNLGINSVILGPGHVAQAHQPDEFVEIEGMLTMVDIVESYIRRFCCHE